MLDCAGRYIGPHWETRRPVPSARPLDSASRVFRGTYPRYLLSATGPKSEFVAGQVALIAGVGCGRIECPASKHFIKPVSPIQSTTRRFLPPCWLFCVCQRTCQLRLANAISPKIIIHGKAATRDPARRDSFNHWRLIALPILLPRVRYPKTHHGRQETSQLVPAAREAGRRHICNGRWA
jgi:hypothetical protein